MNAAAMDRRQFLRSVSGSCLAGAGAWLEASVAADGKPPVEDFFRSAQHSQVTLSPNGRALAAIVPINGRRNIAVIDLANMKGAVITAFKESDVAFFVWVNDRRLVYGLTDLQRALGENTFGGLFAVNSDATEPKELSAPVRSDEPGRIRRAVFSGVFRPAQGNDILVLANERSEDHPDAYRMDTVTGKKVLVTQRTPGRTIRWLTDQAGVVRAALTDEDALKVALHVRDSAEAAWVKMTEFHAYNEVDKIVQPLAFDYDGSLLVSAYANGDKAALYRFDVKEKRLGEKLVAHADYDIDSGLIFDPVKKKLVGIEIDAEKPEFVWFDTDWATWHGLASKALPGTVIHLTRTVDNSKLLVFSVSDREPGTWYFLDPEKRRLEQLVSAAPWIKPEAMAQRSSMRYPARDGLSIPAYLTLPPGRPAKDLPLVVLVHGGPYVRGETWGFDTEAQFLASRGYAVLQPDFRGSLGYGWKHYQAGWKQWGLTMQDDLNDGALHLVSRGIVDKNRMAIMGGSYGGYAVMMGLARDPEFWRCGVNFVGVTDLTLLTTATWSDTNRFFRDMGDWYSIHVGDTSTDKDRFEKTSPLRNADRIKRPVLMAYGGLDQRVVIEHGSRMKRALDKNNVPNEYVVYDKEGHGFRQEANRVDAYKRVDAFLAKHLGV